MTFYECVHEVISLWYFAVLSCNAGTASGLIQLKKERTNIVVFFNCFFQAGQVFCGSNLLSKPPNQKKYNEILILKLFFFYFFIQIQQE
jgi:hypothetical protein